MKARKNIRFNYRLQTFGGHKTNKTCIKLEWRKMKPNICNIPSRCIHMIQENLLDIQCQRLLVKSMYLTTLDQAIKLWLSFDGEILADIWLEASKRMCAKHSASHAPSHVKFAKNNTFHAHTSPCGLIKLPKPITTVAFKYIWKFPHRMLLNIEFPDSILISSHIVHG